jgi:hypothetical protein
VKITWADGEKVTWKRADLPAKGLEVLEPEDADEPPVDPAAAATTPTEQPAAVALPPVAPPAAEPAPEEQAQPPSADETPAAQTPFQLVATEQTAPGPTAGIATAPAKRPRRRPANAGDCREKRLSALDAAAKVLGETGQAMSCREMIAAMAAKGYWTSPGGQTPAATLSSALLRELTTKGAGARFVNTARGRFARKGVE